MADPISHTKFGSVAVELAQRFAATSTSPPENMRSLPIIAPPAKSAAHPLKKPVPGQPGGKVASVALSSLDMQVMGLEQKSEREETQRTQKEASLRDQLKDIQEQEEWLQKEISSLVEKLSTLSKTVQAEKLQNDIDRINVRNASNEEKELEEVRKSKRTLESKATTLSQQREAISKQISDLGKGSSGNK